MGESKQSFGPAGDYAATGFDGSGGSGVKPLDLGGGRRSSIRLGAGGAPRDNSGGFGRPGTGNVGDRQGSIGRSDQDQQEDALSQFGQSDGGGLSQIGVDVPRQGRRAGTGSRFGDTASMGDSKSGVGQSGLTRP